MIISPKHEFAFIHIPKCAGTSVRHQLRACDPDHIFMGRAGDHPVLGRIDYAHIPIVQLREYFPKEYTLLKAYDSFALVRDPLERFGSALRQLLWQYEQRPMTLIPQEELRCRTLEMLDQIKPEIDAPSLQYVFFSRQASYIFDGQEQVIDHVLPVELVPELLDYFSKRTGVALDRNRRSNQNVDLRFKGIGGLAYAVNRVARQALPPGLHSKIKGAALAVIARGQSAAEASGLLELPEVRRFVDEHYVRDQTIYNAAMAKSDALRAELQVGLLTGPNPV